MKKYEMDNLDPIPKDDNMVDEIELQLKKVVMNLESKHKPIVVSELLQDLHSILNYIENEQTLK